MSLRALSCRCRLFAKGKSYHTFLCRFVLYLQFISITNRVNFKRSDMQMASPVWPLHTPLQPDASPALLTDHLLLFFCLEQRAMHLPCLVHPPHTLNVIFSGFRWVPCVHQSHFQYSLWMCHNDTLIGLFTGKALSHSYLWYDFFKVCSHCSWYGSF